MSERQDSTPPAAATGSHDSPGSGATSYSGAPAAGAAGAGATAPEYSTRPVAFRRPDVLAALLLLLAGVAAAVSLLLRWLRGSDVTGRQLVRRGVDAFGESVGAVVDTGFWQPLVIVFGGGVLFVLGLLLLLPARTHRTLGILALLASLAVVAAVLVPLARADWDLGGFALGFWFAMAVAALGLLGALKALLTGAKLGTEAPRT
jgi:hypothetical protein